MTECGHGDGVSHTDQAPHHLGPGPGLALTHLHNDTVTQKYHHARGVALAYHISYKIRDAFRIKKEIKFRQMSKRWEGVTLEPIIKI